MMMMSQKQLSLLLLRPRSSYRHHSLVGGSSVGGVSGPRCCLGGGGGVRRTTAGVVTAGCNTTTSTTTKNRSNNNNIVMVRNHHNIRNINSRTRRRTMSSSSTISTNTCSTDTTATTSTSARTRTRTRRWISGTTSRTLLNLDNIRGPYGSYKDDYRMSIKDPIQFWSKQADNVDWFQKPTKILEKLDENDPGSYRWFSDGMFNTCYNCLDVHVHKYGRGEQVALYYDSPVTNTKRQYTYKELLDEVSCFANVLSNNLGIIVGDRVVIYMPMIPESIIAMLACTRIGAIHSVVFGGFSSKELAKRIIDCQPRLVISASCGVEPTRIIQYKPLLDEALKEVELHQHANAANSSVAHCIIVQRRNVQECDFVVPRDLDYDELMSNNNQSGIDAVPLPANHMHYILYTSGTTGIPKGVVRDTAGWAVALKYSMGAFYNTNPGDVYWSASDIGWIVGHSYIVYGPLMNGSTTILYEGKPVGTPDAGVYWRIIQEYNVKTLFVAPTALRAIKQIDPYCILMKNYDISSLQTLFLAGEHCDPDTLHFWENAITSNEQQQRKQKDGHDGHVVNANNHDVKFPIDHWWQTELGHPGCGNAVGLGRIPIKHGACGLPAPGFDILVVDDNGTQVPSNQLGNMVIRTPLPPGTLTTLYNNHNRYVESYLSRFPGFYDTGDAAYIDDNADDDDAVDGYVYIMGRNDDNINIAGHRLSTGSIEEILQSHSDVAECAVIPMNDKLKGQIPIGFVATISGSTINHAQLCDELIQKVRYDIGPVASFKKVSVVKALPKTRSGKILRGTMTKIANGDKDYIITPTIEDPNIFTYLEPKIHELVNSTNTNTTTTTTTSTTPS